MKSQTTLTELQQHLAEMCKKKGWNKHSVDRIFLLFTEEVGELAKAIRKEQNVQLEHGKEKPETREHLEEEFADVLNYLMDLANQFDIDLTEAYFKKHEKNRQRTWKT